MNTHQQKQAQRSATISKAQRKARDQGNQRTQLIRTILFFNRKGVDYRQHRKILTLTARQGNMFGDSQCSAHTYAWLARRRNWKTMQGTQQTQSHRQARLLAGLSTRIQWVLKHNQAH